MLDIAKNSIVGKTFYQGFEECLEKGHKQGLQMALQDLLALRFGSLPQGVLDQINQCHNSGQLLAALEQVNGLDSPLNLKL